MNALTDTPPSSSPVNDARSSRSSRVRKTGSKRSEEVSAESLACANHPVVLHEYRAIRRHMGLSRRDRHRVSRRDSEGTDRLPVEEVTERVL